MKFLICVEGSRAADEAARTGEALAYLAGAETARIRVVDSQREVDSHEGTGSLMRVGGPVQEILAEADQGNFDLVVIGAHTRHRFADLFLGSTASRLAKQSHLPLIIVKQARESIDRILVCTGGEAPGERCAEWGGRVAAWTGAHMTLLHVISQARLTNPARFDDLDQAAADAIRQGTREGLHLQKLIRLVREAGALREVTPRIRSGLVLDEILGEVESGDYDLVAVGAHYVPGDDAVRGLVPDDITDQIISQCPSTILVVRTK
jgi:nucleotide-binding universal stress UspA family protein